MKEFKFKIEGKKFDVSVNESGENAAEVVVNGKTFNVEIEKQETANPVVKNIAAAPAPKAAQKAASPAASAPKAAGGSQSVKSPLPGSIAKVLVSAGQSVKRGDTIVTIESMKMENSILASKDGTITAVYVQPGQNVLQGDALFDLE
jgi:glutaconyl-CoA/methylmalonyl-CoA decarboxylase subunit gamma